MPNRSTKDRIMDAAEELFASQGFAETSLRGITAHADVNLAAVNYHFGTKEGLVQAIFERRLIPLNAIRLEALDRVLHAAAQTGTRPDGGEVIRAFLEPTLAFKRNQPGANYFSRMIWRAFLGGEVAVQEVFLQLIGPLMKRLLEGLSLALPHIPVDVLTWRLRFAMGAAGQVMMHDPDQPNPLFAGCGLSEEGMEKALLEFVVGGLEVCHEAD